MLDTFFGAQLCSRYRSLPNHSSARKRSAEGRRDVLDLLYRRERDAIVSYLAGLVGQEHAPDLAQEVFMRAASSPQLTRLRSPAAFLRCIARNLSIDFARQNHRRVVTVPLTPDRDGAAPAEQEQLIEADCIQEALRTALAGLPAKTARIFTMNRFELKSYREIHLELGITLSTVDYHMMKALAHLRCAIDGPDRTIADRPSEK